MPTQELDPDTRDWIANAAALVASASGPHHCDDPKGLLLLSRVVDSQGQLADTVVGEGIAQWRIVNRGQHRSGELLLVVTEPTARTTLGDKEHRVRIPYKGHRKAPRFQTFDARDQRFTVKATGPATIETRLGTAPPVLSSSVQCATHATVPGPPRTPPETGSASELAALIASTRRIDPAEYQVVGNYRRHDQNARSLLRGVVSQVLKIALERKRWSQLNNFLLYAPPGAGKTEFVRCLNERLATELPTAYGLQCARLDPFPLNTGDEGSLKAFADSARAEADSGKFVLAFVDEIDSRLNDSWPLAALLTPLYLAERHDLPIVWFCAGSGGGDATGFEDGIRAANRGADFISRFPQGVIGIPEVTAGDKLIIAASALTRVSISKRIAFEVVEATALFFIAAGNTPRQINSHAQEALGRMAKGDLTLFFDHCFEPGDRKRKAFEARFAREIVDLDGLEVRVG